MDVDWPDLGVLDLLVAVGEHGSLSAAARAVGMAQPNASRAITQWEHRIGRALVQRTPRGSSLTTAGQTIAEWARPVLDAAREFSASLTTVQDDVADEASLLSIAASMTIAEALVPRALTTLRAEHPGVGIRLTVCNSAEVFDLVESGTVDLGFVETPATKRALRSETVGTDTLVVAVAPEHAWSRRPAPLTADELARTPLLVREQGSGTRLTLDTAFGGRRPVPPALELGSNSAVRASVLAGAAPAVLSTLALGPWLDSGALVAVPVEALDLGRTLRAVWRGPDALPPIAARLVGLVSADPRLAAAQPM